MQALLQEEVEVEDFLLKKKTEIRDGGVMMLYTEKKLTYKNAVIKYTIRLARANNCTPAGLIG